MDLKDIYQTNMWWLNNTLLNNQCVNGKIKRQITKYLETIENEIQHTKTYEIQQKRAVLRDKCLHQETRNLSNKQPNFKKWEKEEQMKLKVSEWKEMTKTITEINEMETKRLIEKIDKAQSWALEKIKLTNFELDSS